jgi:hypothetical protein
MTMPLPLPLISLLVVATLASAAAAQDTYHAPLNPKLPGGLSGTIVGASGALQRVIAVEPFELKAYEGRLDVATGRFEFRGLPPGEYDLMIKAVGQMYEGVTLESEAGPPPTPAELKQMAEGMAATLNPAERYFDVKHLVRVTGDGERGRIFMFCTRARTTRLAGSGRDFHGHVRRYALVEMLKTRDVWQILTVRHLLRQEVPAGSPDLEVKYTYSPDLGGKLVGERMVDLGAIDLRKLTSVPADRYGTAWNQELSPE